MYNRRVFLLPALKKKFINFIRSDEVLSVCLFHVRKYKIDSGGIRYWVCALDIVERIYFWIDISPDP
jgi:hypothetical protein